MSTNLPFENCPAEYFMLFPIAVTKWIGLMEPTVRAFPNVHAWVILLGKHKAGLAVHLDEVGKARHVLDLVARDHFALEIIDRN
jgi:hypothetical protein